tara:strand:+ start:567 stop:800 length:234 start_codon:yes stop_codon:yes gene_type:complete
MSDPSVPYSSNPKGPFQPAKLKNEDPLASQIAKQARELYAQLGELNLKRKQLKQQVAALDEIELQLESQIVALSKKI